MRLFHGFDDLPPLQSPICTMGSFDGVHCGHQTLLSRCCEYSSQGLGESVVLTFEPHPRIVLGRGDGLLLLTTLNEKKILLDNLGIDNLIVIPFSESFSRLSQTEFIENYLLNRVNTRTLLMGYNHSFGRRDDRSQKHPFEELQQRYEFNIERLEEWQHSKQPTKVSSTTIRNLISEGEMIKACELLGRGYLVIATQNTGNKYTTPPLKLLPPQGRYEAIINSHRETITITQHGEILLNNSIYKEVNIEILYIIRELTNDIQTKTAYPIFDEYSRQSYLDNFLRGGYPTLIDDGKDGVVYYLYSRKHGDLERDYNWFSLAPEYYSQGNGNYRDANQNRRSDSLFKRYVKDSNIKNFMDLIQIDGYNPLSVNGLSFTVESSDVDAIVTKVSGGKDEGLKNILSRNFTPGAIINYLAKSGKSNEQAEAALPIVLNKATKHYEANFGEGYWVDHWTYNFDLVENFLAVYPDQINKMLFEETDYKYFQSPVTVLPRSEKYVLNSKGQVRQYGAINHHDYSKCGKVGADLNHTNWLKDTDKKVYNTNLYEKLLSLAAVKFSTMDYEGMGIEMEGEKPGWNDAMNGLPGIMGSGISETVELARVVNFLVANSNEGSVEVLSEVYDFVKELAKLVTDFNNKAIDQHKYWDLATTLREEFRVTTDVFVSGKKVSVKLAELNTMLTLIKGKVDGGIAKALELGKGILPTYLTYEADDFEVLKDANGNPVPAHYNNLPKVIVKSFKLRAIPAFLEAPARSYKILSQDDVAKMHKLVKKTDLFDKKLNIYRTSVDLDPETMEVGRLRAFTKGWLERESCFLHMTYKYILGLLKAGLYKEFFEEFRNNCVAFMDPEVYGRSTLENSSFIATSCNPDPETHGRGFVSRLTGANTEYLSMWYIMMFGKKVFNMENNELTATFKPVLTADFFDANNEVSAMFLGDVLVTYYNPNKKDTFATQVECIEFNLNGKDIKVDGSKLVGENASKLRDGSIKSIKITLK